MRSSRVPEVHDGVRDATRKRGLPRREAPKSVSVLWALGDPGVNLAVRDAHEHAVVAALGFVERNAAFTRRGAGSGSPHRR